MKDFSFITNQHPAYIESLYSDFVKDPASVDPELKKFFEGFDCEVCIHVDEHEPLTHEQCGNQRQERRQRQ